MAVFNFGYFNSQLQSVQQKIANRGYAPTSAGPATYQEQNERINNLVKPKTGGLQALKDANPDIDFDDPNWNEIDYSGQQRERDYFEQLEQSRDDPRYADRYGWDQYA